MDKVNPARGEVEFTDANGNSYVCKLTLGDIPALEKRLNCKWFKFLLNIQEQDFGIDDLFAVVTFAMRSGNPRMKHEEAMAIVSQSEINDLIEVMFALVRTVTQRKKKDATEEGAEQNHTPLLNSLSTN